MLASILRFSKLFAIAVGMVGLLLFGIFSVSRFEAWRRDAFEDRFSFLDEKMKLCKKIMDAPQDRGVAHSLKSKLLGKPVVLCTASNANDPWPLRRNTGDIDPLMAALPARLVPTSADDTKFAVSLRWGEEIVGKYTDGAMAVRETCLVDVFELDSGERIISRNFMGGDPPSSKKENGNEHSREKVFGNGCQHKIVQFLEEIFAI